MDEGRYAYHLEEERQHYHLESVMPAPVVVIVLNDDVADVDQLEGSINAGFLNLWNNSEDKADFVHTHIPADVVGLQALLDAKAPTAHTHAIADVTNLTTTLAGKAATSHTHTIANVTSLQTTLDGKAPLSHVHTVANVTGLQSALDAKADATAILTLEQLQDAVAAMFQGGTHTNVTVTYDDTGAVLNLSAAGGGGGTSMTSEEIQDIVGPFIIQGTGISASYNDAENKLTIALTGETYTTAEKSKLAGIAAGATVNATDANLRDRSTHTGVQAVSTITGLQATLDSKAAASHTHSWTEVADKPLTFPPSTHSHAWGDITGTPATYPAAVHTHAYSSLTGIPATFAPAAHNHAWGDLTGVPTTFAPAAHVHAIADTTGLQTALDAKAASSHTHTIANITSLQTTLDAKAPLVPVTNAQTGTAYTLVLADNGKQITRNNAAANTVTIPTNASVALPVGATLTVMQIGAGVTTVVGATGVTVNGVSAGSVPDSARYQMLSLYQISANVWAVSGGAA